LAIRVQSDQGLTMVLLFTTLPGRVDPETIGSCMQSPISEQWFTDVPPIGIFTPKDSVTSDVFQVLPSYYHTIPCIGVGDWTSWNG
jgi:hypothetical protein